MVHKKVSDKIKNDFLKNITILASGSLIAYGINFLILPILSRIFSPADIGEYNLIVSTASIFFDMMCLGMLTAIMLPKEEEIAKNICRLIACSIIFFCILIFPIIWLISPRYKIFEIKQNYNIACILLFLYTIVYNIQSIYFGYVNRKKKYRVLFWNQIIYATLNAGISIFFGLLGFKTLGYLSGTVCASLVTIIYMNRYVHPFRGKTTSKDLMNTLYRYRTFPLIQMPANMIGYFSSQISIQFLGRFFGSAVLGGYSMACRILSVPVSLLAVSVNKVYYKTAAEKINSGEEIGKFSFQILATNIKIAIIPICILIFFGKEILTIFLGEEWGTAGEYIRILGVYYLVQFCSGCFSGVFVLINQKKVNMISACIKLLLNIVTFSWLNGQKIDLVSAIIIFTGVDMIFQLILLGLMFYMLNYSLKKYSYLILKYIVSIYLVSLFIVGKGIS